MDNLINIYNSLLKQHGYQGWWPIFSCKNSKNNKGYHPGDYNYPRNIRQQFEICVGAILTQNTAWTNVEKALYNLKDKKLLNAKAIIDSKIEELRVAVKPAGYYNQKADYLKEFALFYLSLKGKTPARAELLAVKGIGPETADSILLYAYSQPEFVVDAYTKRMFSQLGFFNEKERYHKVKEIFEKALPRDVALYQEYHALIVEHAKNNYSRKNNLAQT